MLLIAALVSLLGCERDPHQKSPKENLSQSPIQQLTDTDFEREVLQSSQPVVVDFWAAWCGPCVKMKPALEEFAGDIAGEALVGELDVDENRFTAKKYEIAKLPTILIFQNGTVVRRLEGMQSKAELKQALNAVLRESR